MLEKTTAPKTDNNNDVHVYTDLYHRSRVSVIAYFALFWALVFLTPFFREQRTLALCMGSAVTVIVGIRFFLAIKFTPELFCEKPEVWKRSFITLVLISAFLWGMLNVLVSMFFGLLSWAGVYCMVITSGILAGGANSLAPSKKIMLGFIFLNSHSKYGQSPLT